MTSAYIWPRLPAHGTGQRIGLLGGSFNPAHPGHRHISVLALKQLQLDCIWWLVTPGNPLKDHADLAALQTRIAKAQAVANHPRIIVTGFEAEAGTAYTADTLDLLKRRCPTVRFTWLMGADNLADFHRWDRWRHIAETMPFAVIDRPGVTLKAIASPAARALSYARLSRPEFVDLGSVPPPAWTFLFGPRSSESSTRLRDLEKGPVQRFID